MRAALLGLLLVNILYWTWASQIDSGVAPVARALDPDLPRLELVPRPEPSAVDNVPQALADIGDDVPAGGDPEAIDVGRVGADDVMSVDDAPVEVAAVSPSAEPKATSIQDTSTEEISEAAQNLLAAVDAARFPARCVGVGPFVSLRQASDAAALLNEAGRTTAQRVEEAQVWVGHWVHLPAYGSRAEAVAVVEELREKGVKDIYIEPSGELKNSVSLGLFTELARAEIRAGKVRKLGEVSPQIRNRSRDGLVYWIDVPLDAGQSIKLDAIPYKASEELRLEPVECPPLTANG